MRVVTLDDGLAVDALVAIDGARDPAVVARAGRIVADVRRRGDRAVEAWARRLDGLTAPIEVPAREIQAGWDRAPRRLRQALRTAVRNVRRVAARQLPPSTSIRVRDGVRVEQRVQPLARVGCYVPAGRYPLPSTVIMTVVPARVAGVDEIIVCCPRPEAAVLAAAVEAGASRVFRIGGAHAIAALAYGTARVPRVDKIVGPGNAWVAAAKTLVAADCAVDAHAGPSEIVVLADDGDPREVAADLVAQAEHDPAARAICVTTRPAFARAVAAAVDRLSERFGPAAPALASHSAVVVAANRRQAVDFVNRLAPEHLVCDRAAGPGRDLTAGTIFVGPWSAQALGDYCTGSNHVLPTGGTARIRGGLSAADFVRVYSVQTVSRRGFIALAPAAVTLAEAEGLGAHAESLRIRLRRSRRDRRIRRAGAIR